jgi:hypothetical protein
MNDVLDRLSAANPVTDLDAVNAGVAPLRPPPRRRARRRFAAPHRIAAFAALVAALVLATGLPGTRTSGPGGVGRVAAAAAAAAALDPGNSILHIVMRGSHTGPDPVAQPGQPALVAGPPTQMDVWVAPGGKASRVRTTALSDGAVLSDNRFAIVGENSGSLDPISAARKMLQDGVLKPQGQTVIDGREVEVFRNDRGDVTWYFDARTILRPVDGDGSFTAVTDFVTVERLEDTPAHRNEMDPPKTVLPGVRVGQPAATRRTTP